MIQAMCDYCGVTEFLEISLDDAYYIPKDWIEKYCVDEDGCAGVRQFHKQECFTDWKLKHNPNA